MLTMPHRILKEKLILYHHIKSLPSKALAHKVLLTQEDLRLGGLYEEVCPFLVRHRVVNVLEFSKVKWKTFVSEKINSENREYLIQWSEKYKKVDSISIACEKYERKDYLNKLNLAQSRLKFRVRSNCMKTCRVHYSSDRENIRAMFKCFHCDNIDSFPVHWRTCDVYSKFRESKCLDNDVDLLNYYQQIINLRIS